MHEEKKLMESNIPVVGGEEPTQEAPLTAAPHTEAVNGATETGLTDTLPASAAQSPEGDEPSVDTTPTAGSGTMREMLDQHTDEPSVKRGDILEGTGAQ